MKYEIITSDTTKKYEVNAAEELFFDAVYEEIGEGIRLYRMSDGTLNVHYYTYPIGRIKLQGRKHGMQVLKGFHGVRWIDGDINDFLLNIIYWKKYIIWVTKE